MSVSSMSATTSRHRLGRLPADAVLGSIFWYTIAGEADGQDKRRSRPIWVPQESMEQWFEEAGLDLEVLPTRIKAVDAFRNATSSARRRYTNADGDDCELYIREERVDADQVVRQVMRIVDNGKRKTEDHVATLKFIRGGRTSTGKRHAGDHYRPAILHKVQGVDREAVETLIAEVDSRYRSFAANLTSQKIREIFRDILATVEAIPIKGGMYFVWEEHQAVIDALGHVLGKIGAGCEFGQVPLVDATASRELLARNAEAEIEDDCRLLLKEIAEVKAKFRTQVPPARYGELNGQYTHILRRSADVGDRLNVQSIRAAEALEAVLDELNEMLNRTVPARSK